MDNKNGNNNVLTPEQIAALFASQSESVAGEENANVNDEVSTTSETEVAISEDSQVPKDENTLEAKPKARSRTKKKEESTTEIDANVDTDSGSKPKPRARAKKKTELETEAVVLASKEEEKLEAEVVKASELETDLRTEEIPIVENIEATKESLSVETKAEASSNPNAMLTAEQIAALFEAQSPVEEVEAEVITASELETDLRTKEIPSVENIEATKESLSVETKVEASSNPNAMLSAEQIAALFEAQSPVEEVEAEVITASELETNLRTEEIPSVENIEATKESLSVETKVEASSNPNAMLSAEQIAALFEAQSPVEEVEAQAVTDSELETNLVAEKMQSAEPETPIEAEPSSNPNAMLTAEQIAALFETQSPVEEVEAQVVTDSELETNLVAEEMQSAEPETPTEAEASSNPNAMLTAEQIAALFEAQSPVEEVEAEVVTDSELETNLVAEKMQSAEPETPIEAEASSNPNAMLTAEQIAALFEAQSPVEEVEAEVVTDSELETNLAAEEMQSAEPATPTEAEASSNPNAMLTAEQIAALFEAQSPVEEVEAEVVTDSELETDLVAEEMQSAEPVTQTKVEASSNPNAMLTAEQIAALFDSQPTEEISEETNIINEALSETDSAQLVPEDAPESPETELDKPTESNTDSNNMLTAEQIAALFDSQPSEEVSEEVNIASEALSETDSAQLVADNAPESPESEFSSTESKMDSDTPSPKGKINLLEPIMLTFKNLLSKVKQINFKKKKSSKDLAENASTEELPLADEGANDSITTDSVEAIDTANTEPVVESENDEVNSNESGKDKKGKKTKKTKAPKSPKDKSSAPKTPIIILGAMLLVTVSFAAGYFSRDVLSALNPDPAKIAMANEEKAKLAEQKAKEAEDAAKAKALESVDPKDYTSSMYLQSIILKGQADSKTSIKLNKIDDVSLLSQFPKLRRIRLYDMTGKEDLSVIQTLPALEEILIENSVLDKQFAKGSFDSVTYLEMNGCTVNDSKPFANFKKVVELYADSTKFVSKDGKLDAPALMPALETITLSNCGEYSELANVSQLTNLKKLKLSDSTVVKSTSYAQNSKLESLTVDISFATTAEQLMALSALQNLSYLKVEVGSSPLSRTELIGALRQISNEHPDLSIELAGN